MMKMILFCFLTFFLFIYPTAAQNIHWNNAPRKGLVFQISNKEAQGLLTYSTSDTIFNGLLHNPIDTFDTKRGWTNKPAKGHFILAKVVGNKLLCEYTSVFPYQVLLFREYGVLALQVLDLNGNVRNDAKVKLGWRRLWPDKETKTYRMESSWIFGDNKTATVELDGFQSVYNIRKNEVPEWYQPYHQDNGPTFYSYMICDKNKYRPKDLVRFKSYSLDNNKTPLKNELEIWLSGNYKRKKIGELKPYRKGSFVGEFLLHDSLKLSLDNTYFLELKEKKGRTVANCSFRYEDYETTGDKLEISLSNSNQFFPNKNTLTVKATDVNNLMLKGAKAKVLVRTRSINEVYQPVITLKDTLFYTEVELDPDQPTQFDILPSWFQKSNTNYIVSVVVLNSQNQRMEKQLNGSFHYSNIELRSNFSNDSICFHLLKNGLDVKSDSFQIIRSGERKTQNVVLPYREKINPALRSITLKNKDFNRTFTLADMNPTIKLLGGIQKDSFNVKLYNPQKLNVSWYIYYGDTLLRKGSGEKMEFNSLITSRERSYAVEILNSFGGDDFSYARDYDFKEGNLDIQFDIPDRVYPGQKVEANILVKNQNGEAVSDVDLTAFAVSGKLNYDVPDLPYYGSRSKSREEAVDYDKRDLNHRVAYLPLDIKKWSKLYGLDTMVYYQYTYPREKAFTSQQPIEDSTQVALFVMKGGMSQKVYVFEIDHQPVYYSWVNQPKQYSFYISPKQKHVISARLLDRVLVFDSLAFSEGKKTVISVDVDHLPSNVKCIKLKDEFTETEKSRYGDISVFVRRGKTSWISVGKTFIPAIPSDWYYYSSALIGPIPVGKLTFHELDQPDVTFKHVNGFKYSFEDNVVYKQDCKDLLPKKLFAEELDPLEHINELVMTKKKFLETIAPPRDIWSGTSVNIVDSEINFRIDLPHEALNVGIAAVLFKRVGTTEISGYDYDRYRNHLSHVRYMPWGMSDLYIIYNNGAYFKMDSINCHPHTHIVVDLQHQVKHLVDSISRGMLEEFNAFLYRSIVSKNKNDFSYIVKHGDGNLNGKIVDENKDPIAGATVVVKGTKTGTIADLNGEFSLHVDAPEVSLLFSFIGYETKEIEVTRGSTFSVMLKPSEMRLDEVVVIGYGIQRKSVLTGSVTSIKSTDLKSSSREKERKNEEKTTEGEKQLYQDLLHLHSIRTRFSDVGFWEPKLFTDRKGVAKFKLTFPDDITRWDAVVYAMNQDAETGTLHKSIQSYKPILAELNVPNFLTKGDSSFFIGKLTQYTKDSLIKGDVKWKGLNSEFNKPISFKTYRTDQLLVHPLTTDSLQSSYSFTRDDGYLDGEERTVPVVEQGVIRADGSVSILKNGDQRDVKALSGQTMKVELLDNPIDIYRSEAQYLINYKYLCNEQMASKLIGLIHYKNLMKYEGRKFVQEKDILKMIDRLLKNQNKEFMWSWWDVTPNTSSWVSVHILNALLQAKENGYEVNLNIENIARKLAYEIEFVHDYSSITTSLLCTLAKWGANLDYVKHLDRLEKALEERIKREKEEGHIVSHFKEKLEFQELRQIIGQAYHSDLLLKYKKETIKGEVFFEDEQESSYWYDGDISTNLIAYRIIKKDSALKQLLPYLQMFFLSTHKSMGWNTYESANILSNVLPDLIAVGMTKDKKAEVKLSGAVDSIVTKFPYHLELKGNEVLKLDKQSGMPLYFMQYVNERVTNAKTGVEGFEINSYFKGQPSFLEAGKPVTLRVVVKVNKANFENVMLEIPIPGSCSYSSKSQNQNGMECHREYFKDRTVIFCENMYKGGYEFNIDLLPRFTGTYLLNPAQVSLMYVPVVNANTDMKKVKVN